MTAQWMLTCAGLMEEGGGDVIGEGRDTGDSVDADPSIVAIGIRLA